MPTPKTESMPSASKELRQFLRRAEALIDRLEAVLPLPAPPPDWTAAAFRWRQAHHGNAANARGHLEAVRHPHGIRLSDLQGVEAQKARIEQNTRQFILSRPANNVLLTGARGTGKSSLIKAVLSEFSAQGLRLIEVEKQDLVHLAEIVDLIAARPEKFIIFCDDLSFESGEPGYKAMKSVLDGSIAGMPDNLLVYATSNRRHLIPENFSENLEAKHMPDGEVRPGDTTEEKISLSERFGIWLSFYPFDQNHYLAICNHWLASFGIGVRQITAARPQALLWALERGSRSGRVAWQFARDFAGQHGKKSPRKTSAKR